MGGIASVFKKPKAPAPVVIPAVEPAAPAPTPEPVAAMPDPDNQAIKTEQKKTAARRIASSGRSSTILSDGLGGR